MAGDQKASGVSVGLLKILQSYASTLDVEFNPLAESHGIDSDIFVNGTLTIQGSTFEQLLLDIAEAGNDPCPGLSFGKEAADQYPAGSILFSMMRNCPVIDTALNVFVRYHRIMAENIQPRRTEQGAFTHLSWDISGFNFPARPHLSEALLSTYHSILTRLSQGRIRPVAVTFTHTEPDQDERRTAYDNFFQAPVSFRDIKNALILKNSDLKTRIELADPSLLKVLEQHAQNLIRDMPEGRPWSARVAQLINTEIFSGIVPVMDNIASSLALSRRSIQEKLKHEGTCFRTLVQTVRKQIAIDQLSVPDPSICNIAFLLGYSDQTAFTHAFKRWTGTTPKAFTNQSRIIQDRRSPEIT